MAQYNPPPVLRSDTSSMESRTREERGFLDAEAALKGISTSISSRRPKITGVLSYLGHRNPFSIPVAKADIVWLMDNVAFRGPNGDWQAEFIAAVFDGEPSERLIDAVGDVSRVLCLSKGDQEEQMVESRITPFVLDVQPGRHIKVVAAAGRRRDRARIKLGPGGRNGISSEVKKVPDARDGDAVMVTAEVPSGTTGVLEMRTRYAEPEGWAIISDVDDTIKITNSSDPIGILRSTFVSEPAPVAGMPELYSYLQTMVTASSPFFYLSASPYNLYPFLHEFTSRYYPSGQLILRDQNWLTVTGLLSNLTLGTEKYKVDRMTKVHSWLPKRKMILIGDSTQSDPEAYADMYRAFPGWVKLILIRKVPDLSAIGIIEKNLPSRFELAFRGVPRGVWRIFEHPAECHDVIRQVVVSGGK